MQRGYKFLNFKILIVVIMIILTNTVQFPRIVANWTDEAYVPTTDPRLKTASSSSMNTNIIEGAGYMLAGYSDYLLFLNKIELSELKGIDYTELKILIDRAISNIEQATDMYRNLYNIALTTPYNSSMIDKLKTFDFVSFEKEKRLTSSVFKKVAIYLAIGDVNGMYNRLILECENILSRMKSIKEAIDTETFPEISDLWRLNQNFSELSLFGQFNAEVFNRIITGE